MCLNKAGGCQPLVTNCKFRNPKLGPIALHQTLPTNEYAPGPLGGIILVFISASSCQTCTLYPTAKRLVDMSSARRQILQRCTDPPSAIPIPSRTLHTFRGLGSAQHGLLTQRISSKRRRLFTIQKDQNRTALNERWATMHPQDTADVGRRKCEVIEY
jgi:hypothetical protein